MTRRAFPTLAAILLHHAEARPDEIMLVSGDTSVTWAEMLELSRRTANAMSAAGVSPKSRVALLDKNCVEHLAVLFATSMLNAVLAIVNWRLKAHEAALVVDDAEPTLFFVGDEFVDLVPAVQEDMEAMPEVVVLDELSRWSAGHPADPVEVPSGPDDVCLQLYTSGTTGLPKGAMLTNDNFVAVQEVEWDISDDAVGMTAMPLYHIGGLGWTIYGLSRGVRTVLVREVDPAQMLRLIDEHRVTHTFVVPAVLQFMQLLPHDDVDLSSMRQIFYGASPISEAALTGAMEMFGCDFVQLYGLTEVTGPVVQLDPEDHDPGGPRAELLRSAGRAMAGVELKIADTNDGHPLPDGETGEIWIRSRQVMKGYWNKPDATAKAMPGDGWFRSGDIASMRDGYVFIHDRLNDMIISGGENIYPAEIENVLMSHPTVADAAVIGVPDDDWGETPKALVVVAEGAAVGEQALLEHMRDRLAHYKCPTSVEFITHIPRNPTGKMLKRELRDPYWEGRDRKV